MSSNSLSANFASLQQQNPFPRSSAVQNAAGRRQQFSFTQSRALVPATSFPGPTEPRRNREPAAHGGTALTRNDSWNFLKSASETIITENASTIASSSKNARQLKVAEQNVAHREKQIEFLQEKSSNLTFELQMRARQVALERCATHAR